MSTYVEYDPSLFVLERSGTASAILDEFMLDVSKLGAATSTWIPLAVASFTCTEEYAPNDKGVLIYQTETAQVTISYWHMPAYPPLYPVDLVRATYDGKQVFLGTVESTSISYSTDPDAPKHKATQRVDFNAQLVGAYASALQRTICYVPVEGEAAIDTIRRWITVVGW